MPFLTNVSDEPLSISLDLRGARSRLLLPGGTTEVSSAVAGGYRIRALLGTGALALGEDVADPETDDAEAAATEADEATPEHLEAPMPVAARAEPADGGNGTAAPRNKQVRAKRARKRRMSGGARRSLAKRAALAQTTEAAQAWANGNGHAGLVRILKGQPGSIEALG